MHLLDGTKLQIVSEFSRPVNAILQKMDGFAESVP